MSVTAASQVREVKIVVQTKNAQKAVSDITELKKQLILVNKAMRVGSYDAETKKYYETIKKEYKDLEEQMLKVYKISKDGKNIEVLPGVGRSIPSLITHINELQQKLTSLNGSNDFSGKSVASLSKIKKILGEISRLKVDPKNQVIIDSLTRQFTNLADAARRGTIEEKTFKVGLEALENQFKDISGLSKYNAEVRKQVVELLKFKATLSEIKDTVKDPDAFNKAETLLNNFQTQIRATGDTVDKSSRKYTLMAERIKRLVSSSRDNIRENKALQASYNKSLGSIDSNIKKLDEYRFTLERAIASKKKWTYGRNITEAKKYVIALNELESKLNRLKVALEKTNPLTQAGRFKTLNAILEKTKIEYDRVHSSANKIKAKMSDMSPLKWAGEVAKRAATYAGIYANLFALVNMMRKGVGAVLDFDTSVHKMAAIFDISAAASKRLENKLLTLGMTYGGSMKEINDAALALGRAGIASDKVAESTAIVIKMAKLTGDSISESADAVITYETVFGGAAHSAEQLGDQLAYVANQSRLSTKDISTYSNYLLSSAKAAGMTLETVNALAISFSNAGVNASTIGTQLRTFNNTLSGTSSSVRNFYNTLGISQGRFTAQLKISAKESDAAIAELVTKLKGMSDLDFDRATAGMAIRAKNAIALMRNNADAYLKHVKRLADGVDGEINKANYIAESYTATWEKVKNSVSSAFIGMVKSLLPTIKAIADSIASVFRKISDHSDEFVRKIGYIGTVLKAISVGALALFTRYLVGATAALIAGTAATEAFSGVLLFLSANPIILTLTILAGAIIGIVSSLGDAKKASTKYQEVQSKEAKLNELITKQKVAQANKNYDLVQSLEIVIQQKIKDLALDKKILAVAKSKQGVMDSVANVAAMIKNARKAPASQKAYWDERINKAKKVLAGDNASYLLLSKRIAVEKEEAEIEKVRNDLAKQRADNNEFMIGSDKRLIAAHQEVLNSLVAEEIATKKMIAANNKLNRTTTFKGLVVVTEDQVKQYTKTISDISKLKKYGEDVSKLMSVTLKDINSTMVETSANLSKTFTNQLDVFKDKLPKTSKAIMASLKLGGTSKTIGLDLTKVITVMGKLSTEKKKGTKLTKEENGANNELILMLRDLRREYNTLITLREQSAKLQTAKAAKVEITDINNVAGAYTKLNEKIRNYIAARAELVNAPRNAKETVLQRLTREAGELKDKSGDALKAINDLVNKRAKLQAKLQAKFDKKGTSAADQKIIASKIETIDKDLIKGAATYVDIQTKGTKNQISSGEARIAQAKTQAKLMADSYANEYDMSMKTINARKDYQASLTKRGLTLSQQGPMMDTYDARAKEQSDKAINDATGASSGPFMQQWQSNKDSINKLKTAYSQKDGVLRSKANNLEFAMEKAHWNRLLQLYKQHTDAELKIKNNSKSKKEALAKQESDNTLKNVSTGLGAAGTLMDNLHKAGLLKSKSAARAMQAIQITQAVINTYLSATEAYASGAKINPILGGINAAMAIAAGMANVAAIRAQKFHTGGMVGGDNLTKDEVPAILQTGEYVLSRKDVKSLTSNNTQSATPSNTYISIKNESGLPIDMKELSRNRNDKGEETIQYVMTAIERNPDFRAAIRGIA